MGETEANSDEVANIDLLIFASLALACLVLFIRKKTSLPASGLFMLAGIFLEGACLHLGMLEGALHELQGMNGEIVTLIFLPPLVCECALHVDWYTFKREIFQIALLATTAVVVNSYLTAVAIRYVMRYNDDFDWYSALVLSAILSATDHVAVVAQLKDVNADVHLETLLQGETLVNDGTVIVLFTAMLKGETFTAEQDLVAEFFRLTFGGIALGLAFGVTLAFVLKNITNYTILETLLTLVTAYLLFWTAEATEVEVSGALATVTLGLFISAYAKTMISHPVRESLMEFWETVGTSFEGLLLIMGGMLLAFFFYDFQDLEKSDIGMLFALFVLLYVTRALTILVHWPLLRVLGYGCSYKEMLVLIIGALKGAISVALAVMAYEKSTFSPRIRQLVLFWTAGIVVLSCTLGAVMLRVVVRILGLESMNNVEESMLISVTTSINESTLNYVKKLKRSEEFALADWENIVETIGPAQLLRDALKVTRNGRSLSKNVEASTEELVLAFTNRVQITKVGIAIETRRRLFTTLKRLYWRLFEEGKCFGGSSISLIESADRGLDETEVEMRDWKLLEPVTWPSWFMSCLQWAASAPVLRYAFRRIFYRWLVFAYDIAQNFIRGHQEAEELLDEMEVDIHKEVFEEVMEESHRQVQLAHSFLRDRVLDAYPEVTMLVQTRHASSMIMEKERDFILEAHERGVITEIEFKELFTSVENKIEMLSGPLLPRPPTVLEILRRSPIFKGTAVEILQTFTKTRKAKRLAVGEWLFSTETIGSGGYLVLRGRLLENGSNFSLEHLAGDFIGLQHILPTRPDLSSAISALTASKVIFVPIADLTALWSDEKQEKRIWTYWAKKLLSICKESLGELGRLESAQLATVFANSTIEKFPGGERISLSCGTVLLEGSLANGITAPAYVPGVNGEKSVTTSVAIALVFSPDFGKFVRDSSSDLKTAVSKFAHHDKSASGLKMNHASNIFSRMLHAKAMHSPTNSATAETLLAKARMPTIDEVEDNNPQL